MGTSTRRASPPLSYHEHWANTRPLRQKRALALDPSASGPARRPPAGQCLWLLRAQPAVRESHYSALALLAIVTTPTAPQTASTPSLLPWLHQLFGERRVRFHLIVDIVVQVPHHEAHHVLPRDLLAEEVREHQLCDRQELVRELEPVEAKGSVGVLLAAQDCERHHQPIARVRPAEHVEDEREHRGARDQGAAELADAEERLQLLAEGDEVVHLREQLRGEAAEVTRGGEGPPQLQSVHRPAGVEPQRLGVEQADVGEAGEGDDRGEPRARERGDGEV
mmetsp:Transcript_22827/g.48512  ORF Transcript_22827/g.48512 Transcript_22827/m.48512 type:complete len:279 (-) Transcript_22827:337-1173(-)